MILTRKRNQGLILRYSIISILICCIDVARSGGGGGLTPHRGPDFSPSSYQYHSPRRIIHSDHLLPVDMGTTLVAIKYSGGVVVGADTRTSVGGTYVSNKLAYKINTVLLSRTKKYDGTSSSSSSSSSCVVCRSGSAADTQWLTTQARHHFLQQQLRRPTYVPSIFQIAHYLRYLSRQKNNNNSNNSSDKATEPLQASLICAGYDNNNNGGGGGRIFAITPGGSLLEEESFCVSGSGSTVLLGYLDDIILKQQQQQQQQQQQNTDANVFAKYSQQEAMDLVTKLLRLSIARDASSGGLVRLVVVNEQGVQEVDVYHDAEVVEDKKKSKEKELKGFAKAIAPNTKK
jgi:20S proteasome subunit beta 1